MGRNDRRHDGAHPGALELAAGDAAAALVALRQAQQARARAQAHEAARAGELKAMACAALGDEDTAALELEAARSVFELLGAAPDLARLDFLAGGRRRPPTPIG